jgi:hypothetical protein
MTPINTTAEESTTWNELRLFWLNSQNQKRLSDISTKATAISKAMALNENLPIQFDKPQKSRISTLITKVRLLDLYIHLDAISDKRWFI